MDISFHYYGTYTAARIAGFTVGEATTIAHSAQYVDDSVKYYDRILNKGDYGLSIQPIVTSHNAFHELVWSYFGICNLEPSLKDMREVWVPFHFLPGNYRSKKLSDLNWERRLLKTNGGQYTGPKSSKWIVGWKWDDDISQKEFMHICLPRSPLASKMVTRDTQRSKPEWLHKLGIMMHVYADTGAHMYHAGTPAWHVNDAWAGVYDLSTLGSKEVSWDDSSYIYFNADWEVCTPTGTTVRSSSYLGHGRMGHLPDYPWIDYRYLPIWCNYNETSNNWIFKNNPETYLDSFMDMILALQFQRGDIRQFEYGQNEATINSQIEELQREFSHELSVVKCILNTKPYKPNSFNEILDQMCLAWKDALNDKDRLGKYGGEPVGYDPDKWVGEVKNLKTSKKIEETDYFKFHTAAIDHHDFVINSLRDEEIWLGE